MDDQVSEEGIISVSLETNSLKRFLNDHFDYPFTRLEIFSMCTIQLLGVCHCIIFNSYLDFPLVEHDTKRYPILKTLSILSPVLGFYGLITMKLSKGIHANLMILILFHICPLIIMLVLIFSSLYLDYLELTVACAFVLISTIGFGILKMVRNQVQESLGKSIGDILVITLVICCNLLFNILTSVLLLNENVFSGPRVIIEYTSVLWLIIFVVLWIAINSVVFKKQPNEIQALRNEILMRKNHPMKVQVILTENPEVLSMIEEGFLTRNGHFLASLGIILSFLCVEIWLITIIYEFNTGKYPDAVLYLAIFYAIADPLFLFLGIIFSSSKLMTQDKYFIVLLIVALVPTLFVERLSYYLCNFESTYYLGIVIGIGFPASLVYWLSMAMIFQYNKRTYQYFSSIFCLVFVLPVGVVLPIYYAGGINGLILWTTEGFLLFFGTSLLILWIFQLLVRITKKLCILIQEISRFHSEDLSLYIYSISFLIGYSLISWTTFKRIKLKNDWTAGLLFGSLLILGLTLLSSIFTHRLNLYQKDDEKNEENISEIILGHSKELTEIQCIKQRQKKKYQLILILFWLILTLSISIPLFVTIPFEYSNSSAVTFIVGGFISILIFIILIELKHFLKRFGQTVISFILGYCWLFCFIPFLVLIPVSLGSASTELEQRKITSWFIGLILLLFMIGVSILSIILNLLLNKLEYEKIAKFCCLHVQEMLKENAVKSSLADLRDIYDNFYNTSADAVEKVLLAQTAYSFRKLNCSDKDFCIELLSIKELSKIKNKKSETEKDKVKKGVKLSEFCKKLCKKKERQPSIFQIANFSPEELGNIECESEEAENIESDEMMSDNWEEKFKQDVVKAQEEKEKEIITEKIKADFEDSNDKKIKLDDIPALKLTKKKKLELQNSKELEVIINNLAARSRWTKAVFAKFSNGLTAFDGEPWMNLSDLRNFIRLVGLQNVITKATADILFVSMTRKYASGTNSISHVKINYEVFLDKVIPEILKLVNIKLKEIQTEEDLIKEQIFPYLINNLPYLRLVIKKFLDQEINKHDDDESKNQKEDVNVKEIDDTKNNKNVDEKQHRSSRTRRSALSSNSIKRLSIYQPEQKKLFCTICLDKFSLCTSRCFRGLISCCGKMFNSCLGVLKTTPDFTSSKVEVNQISSNNELREAPPWEVISKLITVKFEETNTEARKHEAKKPVYLSINLTNMIGVLNHIMEIYSFSSISFLKEVGWSYNNPLADASEVIMALNKYWLETYWACFISSMIFVCLLIPALKLIKQNRLGLEADFTVAKFPSPNFFLSKLIGLFGNSIYMTVMCAMLSSFACVYEGNSWYLLRNPNIECFSSEHMPYFVISILTLILYYPAATLILPSIAYQDKVLDIKFDTTYLVLESQGKILIAAVAVFFNKEKYIWIMLVVSIFVSVFLFFTCLKTKPCLVKSYNLWKTGGFLVPVWVCSCALIKLYSQNTFFSIVLLVTGLGFIFVVLVYLYMKFYGCKKRMRNKTEIRILKNEVSIMNLDLPDKFPHSNHTVIPGVFDDCKSSFKAEEFK